MGLRGDSWLRRFQIGDCRFQIEFFLVVVRGRLFGILYRLQPAPPWGRLPPVHPQAALEAATRRYRFFVPALTLRACWVIPAPLRDRLTLRACMVMPTESSLTACRYMQSLCVEFKWREESVGNGVVVAGGGRAGFGAVLEHSWPG